MRSTAASADSSAHADVCETAMMRSGAGWN
jgi:hypothetical protein